MAHAAFYGLGAYTSALLAVRLGVPFLGGLLVGMSLAALASLLVSVPSLRMHDDYFVIVTFGFQMIFFSIFNNWIAVTRGPLGIPDIPRPSFFGWTVRSHVVFLVMSIVLAALSYAVVGRIAASPFGRVLRAIREDEVFANAVGKNTLAFKATAFAVSAALAAGSGSLYASYMSFIDPTSFTVTESILVISIVIIGGAGSVWGPLVGAAVLVTLPEVLRFLGLPSSVAANLREILYGSLLVVMMMKRPRGLMGHYGFWTVRTHGES
jgi:branched-chain amino acid transport system permease protein